MEIVIGFLIAAAIGLTGVGAGVITTPVLIVFFHISPTQAVGTALIFSTIVKLVGAPVYLIRKQVHWRTLLLLISGGLPGVFTGSVLLGGLRSEHSDSLLYLLLGVTIIVFAWLNLYKLIAKSEQDGLRDRSGWLPLIALPIGAETGFSAAGAGAIGSIALLRLTALSAGQIIGTDMFFGLSMSSVGGGIQLTAGHYVPALLWKLVIGGVPGVLAGANTSALLPSRPLRVCLSFWIIGLGAQLFWRGLSI
jgi:uncharacterized membrane protein YfcA